MIRKAKWISSAVDTDGALPVFEKRVEIIKKLKKATAYVSAMGVYDFFINGKKVGEYLLTPGFTSMDKFVQYQEYDIKNLLIQELNETDEIDFSIRVARCWVSTLYAKELSCIVAISLEYLNGEKQEIFSDETWNVYTSQIIFSSWYNGETLDLTAPVKYLGNAVENTFNTQLIAQVGEYVREQERVAAKRLIITPKGEKVIDFGQNLAGYVEIRYQGKKGQRIKISHAEVLDKGGNFYTENYRESKNEIVYVLDGNESIFKPSHTYQGYRYIRLDEFPDENIDIQNFTSIAVYSDMRRTGYFRCGHEKLNRLYENIIWGQRSNFLDNPTDCPQRDERHGWTGDAQIFCRTACINYNVEKFFKKWLLCLVKDQMPDGKIPYIIPDRGWGVVAGSAVWGDACTIIPWELWLAYGNKEILETCYPTMVKWIDYIRNVSEEPNLWIGGEQFGDWLGMDTDEDVYVGATQTDFIASAFFVHSLSLLVKIGQVLGKDVSKYETLHKNAKKAFRKAFMKDGMPALYHGGDCKDRSNESRYQRTVKAITQTSLTLLLKFDLCLKRERKVIAEKLVRLVRENGNRLTTGFVGTPYLLHALSENGYADVAYDLLLQEDYPSWLYSVNHGATTIWEHWDGVKEDGGFWSPEMNSFNHYAYGAVYDWIFGVAAGIKIDEDGVGYKGITISPNPDERIGFMDVQYQTKTGLLRSSWRYIEGGVEYSFTIPQDTIAKIVLPKGTTHILRKGDYTFIEK